MQKKYKSLSIFEFQKRFPDEESSLKYLANIKWANGYSCRKCNICDHPESPTSGTLFHKVKFSLLRAFYIVYYVSTNKKGIASTELSRKLELRQKTCWSFKRKVMKAMESDGDHLFNNFVEIDEAFVGGQEKLKKGCSKGKKKQIAFIIETKGKGISRAYRIVINNAGTKELKPFIEKHVSIEAKIRTDKWRGYTPLKKQFKNLEQIDSEKKLPHNA